MVAHLDPLAIVRPSFSSKQPTQRSGKKNANVSGKDNTPAGRANKRAGSGHGDDDPAGASKRARTARNGSAGAKGRGQGEAMESGGDEGLTAFVVNLAFSTKEKGLRAIFAGCGGKLCLFVRFLFSFSFPCFFWEPFSGTVCQTYMYLFLRADGDVT